MFFIIVGLVEYFVDSGDQPAFIEYPVVLLFLFLVLFDNILMLCHSLFLYNIFRFFLLQIIYIVVT